MRFIFYSLLALLPLLGLPLSASACICAHDANAEFGIDAVPCCQQLPDSCCVQKERETNPQLQLAMVIPEENSFTVTLGSVSTLTEDRAPVRPLASTYSQLARPPPLMPSAHRCQIQSWLL